MTCEFAYDDGAYVLGALSPAERSAYEKHLASCQDCRQAVASVAVLPGLLSRLAAPDSEEPTDRVPKLIEAVASQQRRERRKWRARLAGSVALAACVALLAGFALVLLRPLPAVDPAVPMTAMTSVQPGSWVTAEVGFAPRRGGVEVLMNCSYPGAGEGGYTFTFRLVAIGKDGSAEQVGSWTAGPGDEVSIAGTIRFGLSELVRVELRGSDGKPVLTYDLP